MSETTEPCFCGLPAKPGDTHGPKACAVSDGRISEAMRGRASSGERSCSTQTYWYEHGVMRARFCGRPATKVTQALDGSLNYGCDEHAAMAVEAGAREVDGR